MLRVLCRCLVAVVGLGAIGGLRAIGPAAELLRQDPSVSTAAADGSGQPDSSAGNLAEPLDLVPAESLLCWYGRPYPGLAPPSGEPSALEVLLKVGGRMAGTALDPEARLWARGVEAFNLAIRFPHAIVLIDAQAVAVAPNSEVKRGDRIRFALIVQTNGQNEPFARLLQAAINEQTDADRAERTLRTAARWRFVELRDRRLPEWCTIAWGELDRYFVFAVGPDVWPAIAAVAAGEAPSLGGSEWLRQVRGERGRDALMEIIVAVEAIRERLDPLLDARATGFFKAWEAAGYERSHWALGFEGRALYCVAHMLENGQTHELVFADPQISEARLLATVPENARYAIYRFPPAKALPRFFSSLLATRDAKVRRDVLEIWNNIQSQYGFDAQRDVLAHLGDYIIMHNDPPHPLHLPLAMTTLTEIRDDPAGVRRAIDTLCRAWQDQQERRAAEGHAPGLLTIRRDPDGIWYMHYGLAGPAWTVTDKFIVTSWSPAALRAYLNKAGEHAGRVLPDVPPQPGR